uniref:Mediator of RNA polymerase II transcription subunit 21 n=1 Tax=Araucaria cunninghamii TaxID=56994 RepID=A0A0D6R0L0_ARACU
MDIISQLQEQVSVIAGITFNTIGTLQRDAPPVQLSPNYPEPRNISTEDPAVVVEQPKSMTAALVQAAKQFDALVAALPLAEGGEDAQLRQIEQLQVENEIVGKELQKEIEDAELEFGQIQELFDLTTDNCLNLKPPH